LFHTADTTYDTEIEIIADGYRLKLVDPYNDPVLYIRRPGLVGEGKSQVEDGAWRIADKRSYHTEVRRYPNDDPFYTEISAIVDAVETSSGEGLLSSYEDALRTYEFTWAIRRAGEKG
jgi:hypothetical protein